jgi:DNA helicase HerA-like ATPase
LGKTRSGKSFLALILIEEALKNAIEVVVFDPHGTIADRLDNTPSQLQADNRTAQSYVFSPYFYPEPFS